LGLLSEARERVNVEMDTSFEMFNREVEFG
jgi:hypothetical protein